MIERPCFICDAPGICVHRELGLTGDVARAVAMKSEYSAECPKVDNRLLTIEARIERAIKCLQTVQKRPLHGADFTWSPEEISHRPFFVRRNPQGVGKL